MPPPCCAGPAPRSPRRRRRDGAPVHVLEDGAESATARDDRLEIDLRRALDQDEIEIRFQPQVSVTGGAIAGVEALARWNHPHYGELGAVDPVRVAEGSDYLAQLSDHVQRKAIARRRRLARGAAAPAPLGQHHRRRHRPAGFRGAVPGDGRGTAASRPSG